ncbi:MAG: hypothetical protein QM723_04120 [Myxococcaceae bacterium]
MKIRKLLFAVAVVGCAMWACDFNKTSAQLTAPNVMVATLLATPAVTIGPGAIAGFDFDAGGLDASFVLDSGFSFDAGTITIPPQAAATMFFGKRGANQDVEPTGVEGAMATVQAAGGTAYTMNDQGMGNFSITSLDDGGFSYTQNVAYTFTAVSNGQTFVAKIDNSPPLEEIPEFHPSAGYIDQQSGSQFVFHRPDPPDGQERNLGFVVVVPVNRDGGTSDPTYTNVPKTPLGFLKLVVAPLEWKATTVTVPGTAFPAADQNYLILLQSAKLGGPDSENLFSGSAILAGTADIGVVKTH